MNRLLERGQPGPHGTQPRNARTRLSALRSLLFILLGICLVACAPRREPLTSGQRAAIYERATVQFTNAVLFKPLEAGPTNTLGFKLAPLFIQEVVSTNAAIAPPLVFFEESRFLLDGRPHGQVIYIWRPLVPAGNTSGEAVAQGIRITLNASGSPVIWEVLVDDSGGELIFVSQAFEAAAIKAFGSPLAGRRFASEPDLKTAPNAIVARVIEDGPVAMGPIVHLNAGSCNVSTLVCRCMPTQVKNLLATETYELRPVVPSKSRPHFDKPGEDGGARLGRTLRLPVF